MLYYRCFDDPHKCMDLVPDRVISSKFKLDTTVKLSCHVVSEKCSVLHQ